MFDTIRKEYRRHRGHGAAFVALITYRLGSWILRIKNPFLRWVPWKLYQIIRIIVSNFTKIWLEPETRIGDDFHIIHASGFLAIHPDVVIGDRCGVMHNVTIGMNMTDGVPRIGDDVFIGVNATILGPIVIGDRVRIGANALVVTDVPADSIVQAPAPKIFPNVSALLKKGRDDSTEKEADGETS